MYLIPLEFYSFSRPLIEIKGLQDVALREKILQELGFCNITFVDSFNAPSIPKPAKAGIKDFRVAPEWICKYSKNFSYCWLQVFEISNKDEPNAIVQDLTTSLKSSQTNARRYIPVVLCTEPNHTTLQLIRNICTNIKASLIVLTGSDDQVAISNLVKILKETCFGVFREISKKYRKFMTSKVSLFIAPWACRSYYLFKIGLLDELLFDFTSSTKSYHQSYMALIDEGDKKSEEEFIQYSQMIKDHADCLLLKMILGMCRLGSFKEASLFFQGHLDWFMPCMEKKNILKDILEWKAEMYYRYAEVIALFQNPEGSKIQHQGHYYLYAAREYLNLDKIQPANSLSLSIVNCLEKACVYFEKYAQTRHLNWCKFLLAKHKRVDLDFEYASSWPLIRESFIDYKEKLGSNFLEPNSIAYLWELTSLFPEKYCHLLQRSFEKAKTLSDAKEIEIDFGQVPNKILDCRFRYLYATLEVGKPISCILKITNNLPKLPVHLDGVCVNYLESSKHQSVSPESKILTIEPGATIALKWQVLVQKACSFGISRAVLSVAGTPIRLIFNREQLFK